MPLKKLYELGKAHVEKRRSDIVGNMLKNFGHVIGIEFGDALLTIDGRNENLVEPGMAFNVSVGFSSLRSIRKDESSPLFAVWLADTVLVKADGNPICITDGIKKSFESIYYRFKDADGENPTGADGGTAAGSAGTGVSDGTGTAEEAGVRSRLRSRRRAPGSGNADALVAKQLTLRKRKLAEIELRMKDGGGFTAANKKNVKLMTSLNCYKDVTDYPKSIQPKKIHLDPLREALLLPIDGLHVPFHVSTVRNIVCTNEQQFHILRVNFQVPGNTTLTSQARGEGETVLPDYPASSGLFIKELTFRSVDDRYAALARQIKEMQKNLKGKDSDGDKDGAMATVQPLQLNRTARRIVLKNLLVRSTGVFSRRVVGTLEAHVNGLRFQGSRTDHLDINYSNIKHAVFQPCDREMIVLIHFHLKNPIFVSKKKTTDVQFFTETGNQTDDLDQRRSRSTFDPDEVAEELREKELKKKLNIQFKRFVEGVEEMSRIEFEIPYRELAFKGVPKNSQQDLVPTASCLLHLTEWPPFILTLEDVELICFERVAHGLRSFDIAFVNKNYSRSVRHISNVNVESLDTIKKWLNEMSMVWYEVKSNLNWDAILKTVRADISSFVADGAFDGFLGDDHRPLSTGGTDTASKHGGGSSKRKSGKSRSPGSSPGSRSRSQAEGMSDADTDDDDEYHEQDDSNEGEDDDDEEDDDDSSEESFDESSAGSSSHAGESEDEGLSWDELEKEAIRDDRKRGYDNDEEKEAALANKRKKTRV
eukprot:Lankesteria_metandrocarpae@DN8085_c0_g1_i1.p1